MVDANLRQTQLIGDAVNILMQEIRAAEAARGSIGPWRSRTESRKASCGMDGEIIQQRSSYRQGLVLGLTIGEIDAVVGILLIDCYGEFEIGTHTSPQAPHTGAATSLLNPSTIVSNRNRLEPLINTKSPS